MLSSSHFILVFTFGWSLQDLHARPMLLAWTKVYRLIFLFTSWIVDIVPWWRKSCQCYFYKKQHYNNNNNNNNKSTTHTHTQPGHFVVCMNNLFFTEIRKQVYEAFFYGLDCHVYFVCIVIYNCKLIWQKQFTTLNI